MARRKLSKRSFRTILTLQRLDERIAPALGLGVLAHGGLGAMAVQLHNPHVAMAVSVIDVQASAPTVAPAEGNSGPVAIDTSASFTILVGRGASIEIIEISSPSTNDVSVGSKSTPVALPPSTITSTTTTAATTTPATSATTTVTATPVAAESAHTQSAPSVAVTPILAVVLPVIPPAAVALPVPDTNPPLQNRAANRIDDAATRFIPPFDSRQAAPVSVPAAFPGVPPGPTDAVSDDDDNPSTMPPDFDPSLMVPTPNADGQPAGQANETQIQTEQAPTPMALEIASQAATDELPTNGATWLSSRAKVFLGAAFFVGTGLFGGLARRRNQPRRAQRLTRKLRKYLQLFKID